MHAFFSGRVQRVGFRFTAERMARRLPITGFVKNLPGGRVEIAAEGDEKTLQDFLQEIQQAFGDQIRRTDIEWGEPTGEYEGFGIKS